LKATSSRLKGAKRRKKSAKSAHAQRRTKVDLDYYPTQPWVTRALFETVWPGRKIRSVWEPACGGGHMAEVMREYDIPTVYASDVHQYGYGQTYDFLNGPRMNVQVDWIITNPPYGNGLAEEFTIRALTHPGVVGVAMLCRTIWLEGGGRYERLFRKYPPSQVAVFCDRVGFTVGTCEVGKSGMVPYSWFIWDLASPKMNSITWIPPKSRDRLTRPDDALRFNRPLVERRT
jgi:hypothetical protein